jgi:glycosyltransferase involved in cell wall biosynthesis
MKIALDVTTMRKKEKTGHGYYVAGLLQALKDNGEVEVIECAPAGQRDLNTWKRLIWDQFTLPKMAKKAGADILHTTAFSVPLLYRGKKVATVHDLALKRFPENMKGVSGWFLGRFVPGTFKRADRIIAISDSTKKDIEKFLKLPAEKISVVLNGVSNFYHPSILAEKETALRKFGLGEKKFFLFVGTLEPRKNLSFLIKSLAKILTENPDYKLVLAGKRGWQYEDILEEIKQNNLEKSVIETGYISDEEKRGLYSSALAFCYPSKFEGFGLVVVEAFACGCPVIVAANSSLLEIANGAGVVVPLKEAEWTEAAGEFINKTETYDRYSKLGLARAKDFSWEQAAKATVRVYKDVIKRT